MKKITQTLTNKLTFFVGLAIVGILLIANVFNYLEIKHDTRELINNLQIKTIQDVAKILKTIANQEVML